MQKFVQLTGVAAPLPMIHVDTDKIIPGRYMKTISRTGLGRVLFEELRFRADGSEDPEFILNDPAYRDAVILIAGENFGCGSSREHAPWALLDFGIRCIVAPSFADIFYNNCFKNGMLPIVLPQAEVDALMQSASIAAGPLSIDLEAQTIATPDKRIVPFEIEPFRKECLLSGLSDVGLTLKKETLIAGFEGRQRTAEPWLWSSS
jgi:3-isopropylmalate/(R)-2-methylmalate dehydratase small subunit